MCFPYGGTYFTRDMCFLGGGTYFSRICVRDVGELISLGIFFSHVGEPLFPRDMCFSGGGTHITRDMCFPWPGGGTHFTRDMCFRGGEHISLGICVF